MRRINIFFPEELIERIEKLKKRDGLTLAEIVRRAIIEFLRKQGV